jgi:hypothetical protein
VLSRKSIGYPALALVATMALGGWLAWSWYSDPVRSVQRTWNKMLNLTEKRQWEQIEEMISPEFSSEWGYNRPEAVALGEEILRHFFFLRFIVPEDAVIEITTPGTALLSARLELEGSGSPLAQLAIKQLQEHPGRFLFTFTQEEPGPRGWRLTALSHENPLPW